MYRALLSDLDGTLAETDSLHLPTWVEVLRPHGIKVDEGFYRERISGRSNSLIVADLLPDLPAEEARALADAKEESFRERAEGLEPLPGLRDLMAQARLRGRELGLMTHAPEENVGAILLSLEPRGFFDAVVLSDEVGAVKPDPAPYKAALCRLGVAPGEVLAFEDSTSGISSAVGAGIPTAGIASIQDAQTLRDARAFVVARDFTDPDRVALLGR